MRVRKLMTPEVFTLRPDHKLDLANDALTWQRIRHIPVVDENMHLVGLITHRDLIRAAVSSLAHLSKREQQDLFSDIPVAEIMQTDVLTIEPNSDIREAAACMLDNKVGCLPVIDSDRLVGIITEADFLTLAWEDIGRRLERRRYSSARKQTRLGKTQKEARP